MRVCTFNIVADCTGSYTFILKYKRFNAYYLCIYIAFTLLYRLRSTVVSMSSLWNCESVSCTCAWYLYPHGRHMRELHRPKAVRSSAAAVTTRAQTHYRSDTSIDAHRRRQRAPSQRSDAHNTDATHHTNTTIHIGGYRANRSVWLFFTSLRARTWVCTYI